MFRYYLHKLGKLLDKGKLQAKKKLSLFDPIVIYPYRGYANKQQLKINGRVLEKEGYLKEREEPENIWKNLVFMFKRFENDEIPFAKVRVSFNHYEKIINANEEGFFNVVFDLDEPLEASNTYWKEIEFELLNNDLTNQREIKNIGESLIPGKNSEFVVVSDVDDTIIKSHSADFYLKIKTLLTNTASSRTPFKGVSLFYSALQNHDNHFNPLFFVSGNSWNTYDLLTRFCEKNNIPKAPFFLREWDIDKKTLMKSAIRRFKVEQIHHLMNFYADLPFIFIGDSGQKDTEVYAELANKNPERVLAIYIRKIDKKIRTKKDEQLQYQLKSKGIDLMLISDTYEAARHATDKGLIDKDNLEIIKKEVSKF